MCVFVYLFDMKVSVCDLFGFWFLPVIVVVVFFFNMPSEGAPGQEDKSRLTPQVRVMDLPVR